MKKITHYIFIISSVIFLINIIQIISLSLSRLSEYGFGALLGKTILLIISLFIVYKTRTLKPKVSK